MIIFFLITLINWKLSFARCRSVNETTFQSGFRFQTGLSSLRVSCKRALQSSFYIKKENSHFFHIKLQTVREYIYPSFHSLVYPEIMAFTIPFVPPKKFLSRRSFATQILLWWSRQGRRTEQKQPPEVFGEKRPATFLKRDSNTVVFLWILLNF